MSQKKNIFCDVYALTLPAGPDKIDLFPRKVFIDVSPPSLCMKDTVTSAKPSSNPEQNDDRYLFNTGVK